MHYKNGRLANDGDPVIGKDYNGKVFVGTLHSTVPGATACNGQVARIQPGSVQSWSVNICDLIHAEDGLNGAENILAQKNAMTEAPATCCAPQG